VVRPHRPQKGGLAFGIAAGGADQDLEAVVLGPACSAAAMLWNVAVRRLLTTRPTSPVRRVRSALAVRFGW
jgi:hypothetical protein